MQPLAGVQLHDAIAASWSARYGSGSFAERRALADRIIRRVVAPGETWIDAGCGTGTFTRTLAEAGATGLGVDASPAMVTFAEQEGSPWCPGFAFHRVNSVAALESADGTFDGILCLSVLEYVPDLHAVLGEFARVLRSSGKLVLSIPHRRSPVRLAQKAVRLVTGLAGWRPFPYLNASITAATERELRAHLADAGFLVEELAPFESVIPRSFRGMVPGSLMFVVARKTEIQRDGHRVTRRTLARRIDDRLYPGEGTNWDNELFRRRVLFHATPEAVALDIGAGSGRVGALDVRAAVGRVYGIDRDAGIMTNAHVHGAVMGDAAALPIRDSSLDVVLCANVFEHLDQPRAVLSEARRVLKPGGVLVAKTPNRWHYVTIAARLTPHWFHTRYNARRGRTAEHTFPTHYRANSARQLRRLAEDAGLELTCVEHVEGRPEYLRWQPLLYLLGALYERCVNWTDHLAWLRVVIIATFTKPDRQKAGGLSSVARRENTLPPDGSAAGRPRFSLIVPTYNEESDIAATLESLLRLRGADKEIIVVDDSTDRTPEIVAEYAHRGVRLIKPERRQGRCEARNIGARAARGDVLVFINADVRPDEGFLEAIAPAYDAGCDCVSVMNRVENVDRVYARLIEARRHVRIANGVYESWARRYDGVFWTEGFSVLRWRAIEAGLFASGHGVPIEAGEDARFAEALRRIGCRGRFLPDVVVPHIAPDTLRAFWRTRVGRGAGTPQVRRYLDRWPWWKIAGRGWAKLALRTVKIATVLPLLIEGQRLARQMPERKRGDALRYAWALLVEHAASSVGEYAAYRKMRRADRLTREAGLA